MEKNRRCAVEVTLRADSTIFRAEMESPDGDMRGAIDAAASSLDRQFRKNKTRLAKRLRADAFPTAAPDDFDVQEEKEFDIVKTKRFTVKPMSPEEAILQMNLLQHDYVICRCGACAVDGGHDYLHRSFKEKGCYTDLSEVERSPEPNKE